VDNDPDFSSPKAEDFTSASYIWLSIDSDENYYWRVRAIDRAGNAGEWSQVFCFVRDTGAPPAPTLSIPVNGYITENTTITLQLVARDRHLQLPHRGGLRNKVL
jgi:hypothetical protein